MEKCTSCISLQGYVWEVFHVTKIPVPAGHQRHVSYRPCLSFFFPGYPTRTHQSLLCLSNWRCSNPIIIFFVSLKVHHHHLHHHHHHHHHHQYQRFPFQFNISPTFFSIFFKTNPTNKSKAPPYDLRAIPLLGFAFQTLGKKSSKVSQSMMGF